MATEAPTKPANATAATTTAPGQPVDVAPAWETELAEIGAEAATEASPLPGPSAAAATAARVAAPAPATTPAPAPAAAPAPTPAPAKPAAAATPPPPPPQPPRKSRLDPEELLSMDGVDSTELPAALVETLTKLDARD